MALDRQLDGEHRADQSSHTAPVVYFAHASEDQAAARPMAEQLVGHGINVWFDEWEITGGGGLRHRMVAGLSACTHFLVLLTPRSLKEQWVSEEIDAGFVRRIEGVSKFIPLRLGLPLTELPSLMKGMHSPEIAPDNQPALDSLVSQILGVSAKPPVGPEPR